MSSIRHHKMYKKLGGCISCIPTSKRKLVKCLVQYFPNNKHSLAEDDCCATDDCCDECDDDCCDEYDVRCCGPFYPRRCRVMTGCCDHFSHRHPCCAELTEYQKQACLLRQKAYHEHKVSYATNMINLIEGELQKNGQWARPAQANAQGQARVGSAGANQ